MSVIIATKALRHCLSPPTCPNKAVFMFTATSRIDFVQSITLPLYLSLPEEQSFITRTRLREVNLILNDRLTQRVSPPLESPSPGHSTSYRKSAVSSKKKKPEPTIFSEDRAKYCTSLSCVCFFSHIKSPLPPA